jgi:hypothetical protein
LYADFFGERHHAPRNWGLLFWCVTFTFYTVIFVFKKNKMAPGPPVSFGEFPHEPKSLHWDIETDCLFVGWGTLSNPSALGQNQSLSGHELTRINTNSYRKKHLRHWDRLHFFGWEHSAICRHPAKTKTFLAAKQHEFEAE